MTNSEADPERSWTSAADHAWRYFELHANQRMTVFNFFIAFAGLLVAGIAAALQADVQLAAVGGVLGLLLIVLSFVFWKLDDRAAFLVKHAEGVLKDAETRVFPAPARLITTEPAATSAAIERRGGLRAMWTFGKSFRLVFVVVAVLGALSAIASLRRMAAAPDIAEGSVIFASAQAAAATRP